MMLHHGMALPSHPDDPSHETLFIVVGSRTLGLPSRLALDLREWSGCQFLMVERLSPEAEGRVGPLTRAVREIVADMCSPHRMHRLCETDLGFMSCHSEVGITPPVKRMPVGDSGSLPVP